MGDYANKLEEIAVRKDCPKDDNTTDGKKDQMREMIGKLNWIAMQCMPEISFSVTFLAGIINISTVSDIARLNKLI